MPRPLTCIEYITRVAKKAGLCLIANLLDFTLRLINVLVRRQLHIAGITLSCAQGHRNIRQEIGNYYPDPDLGISHYFTSRIEFMQILKIFHFNSFPAKLQK